MHIEREEFLLHRADEVYPLVRDRIYELLPNLPGIESIGSRRSTPCATNIG